MKKLFLILSVLFFTSCNQAVMGKVIVKANDSLFTFDVEVVRSEEDLRKGLMGRESMPWENGMLFVFDNEAPRQFWMKNTLISLDIIFIDEDFKIVHIEHHAEPCPVDAVQCPLYSSGADVKYVLEINGGLANELGILEGNNLSIEF